MITFLLPRTDSERLHDVHVRISDCLQVRVLGALHCYEGRYNSLCDLLGVGFYGFAVRTAFFRLLRQWPSLMIMNLKRELVTSRYPLWIYEIYL